MQTVAIFQGIGGRAVGGEEGSGPIRDESKTDRWTWLNRGFDEERKGKGKGTMGGKGMRCCYLLVSSSERYRGRTYIGFTVNPARRIRQHNGEIGAGAKHTRRMRPWRMVLVLHGFPSKKQALQFEWAWQHPNASLVAREAAAKLGRKAASGLAGKVKLMHEMLHLPPWKHLPLTLQMLNTEFDRLRAGCRAIPQHMSTCVAPIEELLVDSDAEDESSQGRGFDSTWRDGEDATASGRTDAANEGHGEVESVLHSWDPGRTCAFCNHRVEREERLTCTCSARFHLICAAMEYLRGGNDKALVPKGGTCPACRTYNTWAGLVARATRANHGTLLQSPPAERTQKEQDRHPPLIGPGPDKAASEPTTSLSEQGLAPAKPVSVGGVASELIVID